MGKLYSLMVFTASLNMNVTQAVEKMLSEIISEVIVKW